MMLKKILIWMVIIISLGMLGLVSCQRVDTSNLKQIEQKQSGDYFISIFHETGKLKTGKNTLIVEFRWQTDNQLADPGNVRSNVLMPMGGAAPMMAPSSVEPLKDSGSYKVTVDFSMRGTWFLNLSFGSDQKIGFELSV